MQPKPEQYFLRYAFPCAFIILGRAEIDLAKFKELENAAINNIALERKELERIFYRAFEKIERLAAEKRKDKWDLELIKEYFLKRHNKAIDEGRGFYATSPKPLKELCKVYVGKVIEKNKDILTVETENGKRKVLNHLIPEAKPGDKVTIHYGYGVEIL